MQFMSDWINGLGAQKNETIQRLSKEAVRNHENTRIPGNGGAPNVGQQQPLGYPNQFSGVVQTQSIFSGGGGRREGDLVQVASTETYAHTSSHVHQPSVPASGYQSYGGSSHSGGPSNYAPPPGPHNNSHPAFYGIPSSAPVQPGYPAQGGYHDQSGGSGGSYCPSSL